MLEFDGFDWDVGNWPKCGKHGVGREEIERVFADPSLFVAPDVAHSVAEQRWIAIGRNPPSDRWILVIFTKRGRQVRPVSARFMHAQEVMRYGRR